MKAERYYFSLQYSAIQKAVLRHDRLWSMAGISQILSRLNEIRMREIVENDGGTVIVSGGGKFTASFLDETKAKGTREKIIKTVSTTLPMLEFQASSIPLRKAESLQKAKEPESGSEIRPGVIQELGEQKRCFRGYGVTFNPHLEPCAECAEYPAIHGMTIGKSKVCSICHGAYSSKIDYSSLRGKAGNKTAEPEAILDSDSLTTMEKIYLLYFNTINKVGESAPEVPINLENLFPDEEKKGARMAVWFSDLNNMNDKVPLWLNQDDDSIRKTFDIVKKENIKIVSDAVIKTFPATSLIHNCKDNKRYIPFRLIVAGGDDLCIVMPEKHIIRFALNLSGSLKEKMEKIEEDSSHPLNKKWLKEKAEEVKKERPKVRGPKPYSFGGSFVVAPVHSPFRRLHEVGEKLMAEAKKDTDRMDNSINWRVLAEEETPESERIIKFEKPLFIEGGYDKGKLSFRKYIELCDLHPRVSGSHVQQIISRIIDFKNDPVQVEKWMKKRASAALEKSFANLLVDPDLRDESGQLDCRRLATLLELSSIKPRSEDG